MLSPNLLMKGLPNERKDALLLVKWGQYRGDESRALEVLVSSTLDHGFNSGFNGYVVALYAGLGYTTDEFTGALVFDPLIEKSFDLYFTRFLSPRCQVGTHISRLYEKGLTSAKVASSYIYNSQTTLKGRFDDKGLVAGLLQFSPTPLVTFSLLAEVNSRDLKAQPNVGLSLSVLAA